MREGNYLQFDSRDPGEAFQERIVCAQAPTHENVETEEVVFANAEETHGDKGVEDSVQ